MIRALAFVIAAGLATAMVPLAAPPTDAAELKNRAKGPKKYIKVRIEDPLIIGVTRSKPASKQRGRRTP